VTYIWQENVIAKRVVFPASRHRLLCVLQFFLYPLFPIIQRGGAYAVLIGGWSLAAYLIQWTWGNLKDLIVNHNQWVIGYLVVVGEGQQHLISFFFFFISILPFPVIYMQPPGNQSIILVVLLRENVNADVNVFPGLHSWRDFARKCGSFGGRARDVGEATRDNLNLTTH